MLRDHCALVGAAVRAAILAKAPRRTVSAVAAASIAAVTRSLRPEDAAPADASGAVAGAGYTAAAGVGSASTRAARAAKRTRRRAAKRAAAMDVDKDTGQGRGVAGPSGGVGAPVPSPGPSPSTPLPAATLAAPSQLEHENAAPMDVATGVGVAAPASGAAAASVASPAFGAPPAALFSTGERVIIAGGEFEGGSGVVASVEAGTATVEIAAGVIFADVSPVAVRVDHLVRRKLPAKAHGRRAGKRGGRAGH